MNLLLIWVFFYGLLIGSFLNVVIYRLPRDKSVVRPRSSCIKCGHQIKWYENIPVFSYIFLKGKCSNCKTSISIKYPLIELLIGCFAVLLFPHYLTIESLAQYLCLFFIACIFVALFFIDIEFHLLPDKLNLYLLVVVLSYALMTQDYIDIALGFLIGFGGTYFITYLFYKIKGQIGLGGGDIKLFGILGLLLGPQGIVQLIFYSAFLGSIVGITLIATGKLNKNKPLAFGPYILIVAAFQIFFPALFESVNIYNLQ